MAKPIVPQKTLFTRLHLAENNHYQLARTAADVSRFVLIFSLEDPDWISWYSCEQTAEHIPGQIGPQLARKKVWGWSQGGDTSPFDPRKPRKVDEFGDQIGFRAHLEIRRIDSRNAKLAVGMNVFLDSPQTLNWSIWTAGAEVPTGFRWGLVEKPAREAIKAMRAEVPQDGFYKGAVTLITTEPLVKGLRLGASRFL